MAREDVEHAFIADSGRYDLDGVGDEASSDREASRAHEQRTALALADGVLERSSSPPFLDSLAH